MWITLGELRIEKTKSGEPRRFVTREDVTRALAKLKGKAKPGDPIFPLPDDSHAAETFRADLQTAEVERAELYESSDDRLAIRVHDLRATFVVMALMAGRSERWIMDHRAQLERDDLALRPRRTA